MDGLPRPAGDVSRTKAELDRIGQDLEIGIAWNIAAPLPIAAPGSKPDRSANTKVSALPATDARKQKTPWHFLSFPCDESIGNAEIARRLDGTKSPGVARWIVLDVLPREGHATRERIVHLVDRMLTAKMHGAEAIFVSDPLDPDRGLVDRNGSPGELFLPWRTTALMLGGAPYLGDIDLPQGNQIHCFGGNEKYVGVLEGRKPGEETVYLGPELRMCDLWGNSRACPPTISSDDGPTGLSPAPAVGNRRAAIADVPRRARWPHHAVAAWHGPIAQSITECSQRHGAGHVGPEEHLAAVDHRSRQHSRTEELAD